jgi:hypothetical protein
MEIDSKTITAFSIGFTKIKLKAILAGFALSLIATLMWFAGSASALSYTCTWTGATNKNWSVANNWANCNSAAPQNGDSLIFPVGILGSSSAGNLTNDISNLQLANISFSGTNANHYAYNISGNAVSLSGGITDSTSPGSTVDLQITLTANQTFSASDDLGIGDSSSNLNMGTNNLILSGTGGDVDINSAIVGSGELSLDGTNDTWGFLNNNDPSFSGALAVQTGRLIYNAAQPTALGSAAVTIADGATLQESINSTGSYTISNAITMTGDGDGATGAIDVHAFSSTGSVNFTGPITLLGDTQIGLFNADASFTGTVSGCGYTMTSASGSSGTLSGNLVGICMQSTNSGSSSSAPSGNSPDTGYGRPSQSNPIIALLIVGATISTATGLALLYRQKQTYLK